ncbi:polymorphic toxin type 15 domain-containing protein [Stenotrophomonas sp. C3(2023)]|uniref:polymorphic toxin type 15 domain-containing protein n=1 Tax=Stenotrophomonas sp. C3(2023) TaxID=3080277 RepID=UPI00293D0694|nr:polymorphic toxin type 15 domain-containing protein [Stenotrophomonas sp. C3(2023)]MDV3467349.1 polymorphic toxin type 15 domain-containing protein [Stenotrophomonas sp. C3(2023)]
MPYELYIREVAAPYGDCQASSGVSSDEAHAALLCPAARVSLLAAAIIALGSQHAARYAEAQLRHAVRHVRALQAKAQAGMAAMPCLRLRFSTQKLPPGKFDELDKQLAGQQEGLNALTVEQYLQARARFGPQQRNRNVARHARSAERERLLQEHTRSLLAQGLDAAQAQQQAEREVERAMRTLHALHNPDLVAGGRDEIAGFGDGQVNSTIGRQWSHARRGALTRVQELDRAAAEVAEEARSYCHMNGLLERGD